METKQIQKFKETMQALIKDTAKNTIKLIKGDHRRIFSTESELDKKAKMKYKKHTVLKEH